MSKNKTDRQRAQDALDVAQRKVDRTAENLRKARKLVTDLEGVLDEQERRRDFLALDPALPQEQDSDVDDERVEVAVPPQDGKGTQLDDDLDDFPLDERIRNGV